MSSPPPPPPPQPSDRGAVQPVVPGAHPLAPVWMRIVARFLDALIIGFVFGSIFSGMFLGDGDDAGVGGLGAEASFASLYAYNLMMMVVGFGWDAVATKQFGGSPMKLAFGMRVVDAADGTPVGWRPAIVRWAVPGAIAIIPIPILPGFAGLIIIVVSVVFLFTKPLRQAVWDLAGRTMVVSVR